MLGPDSSQDKGVKKDKYRLGREIPCNRFATRYKDDPGTLTLLVAYVVWIFVRMVRLRFSQSTKDKKGNLVVKRGNVYCKLPFFGCVCRNNR